MDSGLEAAGALATAAAAANAIDPDEPRHEGHGAACLNCGATVTGAYCSNCGQKAHVHRSVLHAVEEFLHGITHFDSKLWNTLPLLFVRPGKLTHEYVHGKRARYVAPVAMFLLTVFSMFLLFGFVHLPELTADSIQIDRKATAAAQAKMDSQLAALDRDLAAAQVDPARAEEVTGLKLSRMALETGRKSLAERAAGQKGGSLKIFDVISQATMSGELKVDLGGNKELEEKATNALISPEFVFYKMKQKGYKLSFLLVPLSLPWMILLFAWNKNVKIYDHVVFLLYSISFMSMLAMVAVVMASLGVTNPAVYGTMFSIIPVAHMFAQLKEGYALGWFSAAWRTFALANLAAVTLSLYFIGILLLGLLD
ncbi:MAG: DUF3667 domain-containing protein [Sandaracinobacter sp.]